MSSTDTTSQRRLLQLLAAGVAIAYTCTAARAAASPYDVDVVSDASALAASTALWLGPVLLRSSLVHPHGCPCAAADVNGLDRATAGVYRPGISLASNVGSASLFALVLLLDTLDVHAANESVTSLIADAVVIGEAVLINGALNELTKLASARPRPLLYGRAAQDPLLSEPDNYLSFYSSHTSSAFALGLAYAQTFAYRHPDSGWRFVAYAAALAAGSGMGAARVASGQHFPTDVLAGAAAGAIIGLAVPWLHARGAHAQLSVQLAPDRFALALALRSP